MAHNAFWEWLLIQPYEWVPVCGGYGLEPFNPPRARELLALMKRKRWYQNAMSRGTNKQQIGTVGEAFVWALFTDELEPPYLMDFNNKRKIWRKSEDNEAIDFSFKYRGVWVHVCVKTTAQDKRCYLKSSDKFYELTDDFMAQPEPTMVVRCRMNRLGFYDPMGAKMQLFVAVIKNF